MANSMVFYKSFLDAVEGFDNSRQLTFLKGVLRYGLCEEEPNFQDPVLVGMFCIVRPLIDANNKRKEDGKKGGRPKKPKVIDEKTIGFESKNHRLSKSKPNVNVNANENANANGFVQDTSSYNAYARGGEMNPDDDYEERHEGQGETHFKKTVKLGLKHG